ncbi:hypothetical protein RhiirA5_428775 [Rhizophagus irregularis]|uniref:Uncharacterized protein n=1 Tax=Rhizophagus irregularis TaxID=588596 RepID=A0A2N0NZR0_9GLOM|nr:hypothetical protein RhiirA5_428775 [Rhizophagus irregularis]
MIRYNEVSVQTANSTIVAPSVQQKQREASIEIVIPSVPLPIMTNNNQEFALNYSMVHDTFNTNILPLDVNISRSMEKVPTADNTVFYLQIVNDVFQKEINEKLNIMLEKVDQLITPEDSYWKNLASKTCKVQLPLLGLYSDDLEFKKGFEIELYLYEFGFK